LKRKKKGEWAAFLKNSVRILVEKMYKMRCLEGNGVPVLYIGRTVPKDLLVTRTTGMSHIKV